MLLVLVVGLEALELAGRGDRSVSLCDYWQLLAHLVGFVGAYQRLLGLVVLARLIILSLLGLVKHK